MLCESIFVPSSRSYFLLRLAFVMAMSAFACDAAWAPPLLEVWANGRKELDVRIPRARFVFMEPFQARASSGLLRIELKGRHGWISAAW